jgi:hypothetical protein
VYKTAVYGLIIFGSVYIVVEEGSEIFDREAIMSSLFQTHLFDFMTKSMRAISHIEVFIFQFGISIFLMTLLTFINGYLNHLKLSIRCLSIRDPKKINVDWISDYDAANEYDIQYCVTLHQYIIR